MCGYDTDITVADTRLSEETSRSRPKRVDTGLVRLELVTTSRRRPIHGSTAATTYVTVYTWIEETYGARGLADMETLWRRD